MWKGRLTVKCMKWTCVYRSWNNRQNRIFPGLHFPNHFLEIIILYFDHHFTVVCYKGCNWLQMNIALSNGRDICMWTWIVTFEGPRRICWCDRQTKWITQSNFLPISRHLHCLCMFWNLKPAYDHELRCYKGFVDEKSLKLPQLYHDCGCWTITLLFSDWSQSYDLFNETSQVLAWDLNDGL